MNAEYGSNSVQANVSFGLLSSFPEDQKPSTVAKSKALARPLFISGISHAPTTIGARKKESKKKPET